jgi:hypothetical protein
MLQHCVSLAIKQNQKTGLMVGCTIKTRWMLVKLLATIKDKEMKYEFDTTVGEGSVIVTVVMEYEQDEEGIYNENIEDVIYEKISLMGIFTAEQYRDLEIEGSMRLSKHILDEADHAKTVDYDMRCV